MTDVPSVRAGEKRTGLRALPVKIKNSVIKSYDSYIFLTEQMNKLLNVKKRPYVIIEGFAEKVFWKSLILSRINILRK